MKTFKELRDEMTQEEVDSVSRDGIDLDPAGDKHILFSKVDRRKKWSTEQMHKRASGKYRS